MGKIQLTEGQYERLKKRLINEVGYYNNWIDVDFVNGTLTLNDYLDCERKGGGSELRMYKNTKFTKKPSSNELVANTNSSDLVGDIIGDVEEELGKATIRYSCNSKTLSIDGRNATFWGEDWARDVQKGFDDLCVQKLDGGISTAISKGTELVAKSANKATSDKLWYNFPCVPSNSGAKSAQMSNGSTVYTIGTEKYYNNGRMKKSDGTMVNYYCDTNNKIVVGNKPTGGKSTSQKTYSKPKTTSKATDYLD